MSPPNKHLSFIRSARVAHLATADKSAQPHVVPICFAFDGKEFFSAIDQKPKQVSGRRLKRLRNIGENSSVALIVDHYEEDWRHLAYVLITGKARVLNRGTVHRKAVRLLRRKYAQYREMTIDQRPIIAIKPVRATFWGDFSW